MKTAYAHYVAQLREIAELGLQKPEYVLDSPQGTKIRLADGRQVLNLCANNYLGLADDPRVIAAAEASYQEWGYGLASVRFICGTQRPHKMLEAAISEFVGQEDAILYSSCFDANGGLFETLLSDADAVISDELNHASIIDGIRLCKAKRYRYHNNDMDDLRRQLEAAQKDGARIRLIATDGVFSMDGTLANLPAICDLADEFDALVMVDDSHAVGFIGPHGGGTPDHYGLASRVDILTGTFGKALGGASGGYTCARRPIVDLLRQRSRPYLFSNTLAPAIVAGTLAVLGILRESGELRERLLENTRFFRQQILRSGFVVIPGDHPIVPVMIYDETKTQNIANRLQELGVYVRGFTFPVVPQGKARIRTQVSAAHTEDELRFAAECFQQAHRELM
jgi:glycine C-acetyltransferase